MLIILLYLIFSRGVKRKSTDRKSIKVPRNSLDRFTVVVDKDARSDGLLTEEEEHYWKENFRPEDAHLEGEITWLRVLTIKMHALTCCKSCLIPSACTDKFLTYVSKV